MESPVDEAMLSGPRWGRVSDGAPGMKDGSATGSAGNGLLEPTSSGTRGSACRGSGGRRSRMWAFSEPASPLEKDEDRSDHDDDHDGDDRNLEEEAAAGARASAPGRGPACGGHLDVGRRPAYRAVEGCIDVEGDVAGPGAGGEEDAVSLCGVERAQVAGHSPRIIHHGAHGGALGGCGEGLGGSRLHGDAGGRHRDACEVDRRRGRGDVDGEALRHRGDPIGARGEEGEGSGCVDVLDASRGP